MMVCPRRTHHSVAFIILAVVSSQTSFANSRAGLVAWYSFDDPNDMQLLDTPSLRFLPGDFTLAVFVRGTDRTNQNWFTKADQNHHFGLGGGSVAGIAFYGGADGSATGTSDVFDGKWHHVAGVKRGLSIEIWVDGVLEDTGTWVDAHPESGAIAIGRDGECCEDFIGQMDEAKIWNYALTQAEIEAEARASVPSLLQPTVASAVVMLFALYRMTRALRSRPTA